MVNIIELVKSLFTKDDGLFQKVRCAFLGKEQDLNVLNFYGISFNPPDESFGVSFSANGYGDERFVAVDRPDLRFKGLEKGEMKIGNYLTGAYVHWKADGSIEIVPNGVPVNIIGNVTVTGTVTAANFISTAGVGAYNTHTHSGVDPGPGNTGGPN